MFVTIMEGAVEARVLGGSGWGIRVRECVEGWI